MIDLIVQIFQNCKKLLFGDWFGIRSFEERQIVRNNLQAVHNDLLARFNQRHVLVADPNHLHHESNETVISTPNVNKFGNCPFLGKNIGDIAKSKKTELVRIFGKVPEAKSNNFGQPCQWNQNVSNNKLYCMFMGKFYENLALWKLCKSGNQPFEIYKKYNKITNNNCNFLDFKNRFIEFLNKNCLKEYTNYIFTTLYLYLNKQEFAPEEEIFVMLFIGTIASEIIPRNHTNINIEMYIKIINDPWDYIQKDIITNIDNFVILNNIDNVKYDTPVNSLKGNKGKVDLILNNNNLIEIKCIKDDIKTPYWQAFLYAIHIDITDCMIEKISVVNFLQGVIYEWKTTPQQLVNHKKAFDKITKNALYHLQFKNPNSKLLVLL